MKLFPRTTLSVLLLALTTGASAQNLGKLKIDGSYVNRITRADVAGKDEDESATARREAFKQRFDGLLNSEFAAGLTQELERQRQLYPQQVVNHAGMTGSWRNIGPTNASRFQNGVTQASTDSGRLRAILQDPTDPNTVYVLVGVGGLWKTTNFFDQKPNWVALTDSIGTAGGGVAFGSHHGTIYYGTGDPVDWGVGGAMYRSTDGGQTWSSPTQLAGVTDMGMIAVQPQAGGPDIILVGTNVGVYRSTNGGDSYSLTSGIPTTYSVWNLVKTSAGWLASAKVGWFNGTDAGVWYRSTDDGATWTQIAAQPSGVGRTTFAVGKAGDSVVYAMAADPNGDTLADLFRSTDGGLTWAGLGLNGKQPVNPDPYTPTMNLLPYQGWYNHLLVVDSTDTTRNTVYMGGVFSSAKTTDGGNTWRVLSSWLGSYKLSGAAPVSNPYVHADMHFALVGADTKGKPVVFFGTDGGLFWSPDGGKSFNSNANEGLVTHMIYGLASTPVKPDAVLIGLQDNGTRYRVSSTTTYNGSIGGDGFGVGWSQANNDYSLGSLYYGDIRRFANNPPNVQNKYERVPIPDSGRGDEIFYTPMTTPTAKADPTGHAFFTATQTLVYRTKNAGTTWEPILDLFNLPTANWAISYGPHVVGVSPTDMNRIAVAAYYDVYYTEDGGQNWTTSTVNIPGFERATNAEFSADNKWLYVASETRSTSPSRVRVAKRDNVTGNWIAAGSGNTGLPNVPIFRLAVDPKVADGSHVFAGTWIGVYETTDGGATWHLFGSGLPSAIVFDMYLFPDGSKLRIGTYGRGVWEMPL